MRLELTGRNIEISPALRRLVDRKLAKLDRLLNDGALSAQVVLTQEKYRQRAEITLHARGEKFLHGVGNSDTWETSAAEAVDKIVQQAQRVKGKWQARKRRGREAPPEGPVPQTADARGAEAPPVRERLRMPAFVRASRQTVAVMSIASAAREVRAREDGLIVFRQSEAAPISVLHRRKNGDLVLVETEG